MVGDEGRDPTGKRLVFRTADKTGKGLRIAEAETGEIKVLTEGDHTDNFPDLVTQRGLDLLHQ